MLPTDLFLDPSSRLYCAVLSGLAYVAVCAAIVWRARNRRQQFAAVETAAAGSPTWLVAFASQTGMAEALALHAAQRLNLAGMSAQLAVLDSLTCEQMVRAERVLFIVSTYGEGDCPDNAGRFESMLMSEPAQLAAVYVGVLALGDASYAAYCGFGRRLDAWLLASHAQPLFARIEVDRGDSAALAFWHQQLNHLAGSSDAPDWAAPAFESWQLQGRRLLNLGSQGSPLFELMLVPVSGVLPQWQSGDLVQILALVDTGRHRDYSIASLPDEGGVKLLVRLHCDAQGYIGKVSGWLTQEAAIGESIKLRVRPHRLFRLEENLSRPLIFIGNGSGLAGLLGHLKARIAARQSANWLIYGERNRAHDSLYADTLEGWLSTGSLRRLDRTFSRDGERLRYVQDVLREAADELRIWIANGAALYVCGSLQGMASGVDLALTEVLGDEAVSALKFEGRYRRDVY